MFADSVDSFPGVWRRRECSRHDPGCVKWHSGHALGRIRREQSIARFSAETFV